MARLTNRQLPASRLTDPALDSGQRLELACALLAIEQRTAAARSIIHPLETWSKQWPKDQPVTLLWLGSGLTALPTEIASWGVARGYEVRVTVAGPVAGAPPDETTDEPRAELAERFEVVPSDLRELPFEANSFDYCLSSTLLHQLPDIEVMTLLRHMERIGKRGLVWSGLLRGFACQACLRAKLLLAPAEVRRLALTAARAGFRPDELRELRARLDMQYLKLTRHGPCRFTLAGEHRGAWRLK